MTNIKWIAEQPKPESMIALPRAGMTVYDPTGAAWLIVQCVAGLDQWAVVRVDGTKLDFAHREYKDLVEWLNDNEMKLENL